MPAFQIDRTGDQTNPHIEVIERAGVTGWVDNAPLSVVGKPHARLEGVEKVTGRARYAYDVRLPGQLYARVLRSPYPHARIIAIDTRRAEQLPGVHAVLSSANAPEIAWYETSRLFDSTVRFIGDEVAVVAAESEDIAGDALRLIEITYEPLPFITDIETALDPNAPRVWPEGNLEAEPKIYDRGDAEVGLRNAEVQIDRVYRTSAAVHNSLEPHGSTAWWGRDSLTLWSSTQSVFSVRERVAEALELPLHRVRVITEHMGGGFGAKQISWKQDVLAALLSRESGRPVQLMLDRRAENLAVGHRNTTRQHVRLGATRDGTLTAIWVDILQARGAYATGGEASNVSGMYQTLYRCANVHTRSTSVYLNTGPAVAFRGPGHVEAAFALEQAMDELARQLNIDPIELRRRNYSTIDQLENKPYSLPEGLQLCYKRIAEVRDRRDFRQPSAPSKRRGIGFAAHDWVGGAGHPPGYAWIELHPDGTANVITGTQDIGTGTRTGLAQIAAEELGLPLDDISFQLGDTGRGPYAPVSSGSATQATIGPALREAAAGVKAQLLDLASTVLEIPATRLRVREGMILVEGSAIPATSVKAVIERIAPASLRGEGARSPNPSDFAVRTFGAQFAEVEVDVETGEIDVLRIVTAHDVGRIVNPRIIDSQVIGGIIQGLGFALTEERIVDHRLGHVMNADLEEYHVPTVADIPAIENLHVDVADTNANSTGVKGVGEPPLVPTAPAIANAIFDAVGIRLEMNPFTKERMLEALTAQHMLEKESD